MNPATPITPPEAADAPLDDAGRREALAKLAAWTPPVLLTLLLSRRASAESLPGTPEGFSDEADASADD
jgi:hypothetical protein